VPLEGSVADEYCELIPITITGDFTATDQGLWEGSTDFTYSSAQYGLRASNLQLTREEYRDAMDDIYVQLQAMGAAARNLNAAQNLLSYVTKSFHFGSNAHKFYFQGDAASVLNREHTAVKLANRNGVCGVELGASVDRSTGVVSVTFNRADILADPLCSSAIDPDTFPYDFMSQPREQTLELDMRSAFTAAAVNRGAISLSELDIVTNNQHAHIFEGLQTRVFADFRLTSAAPIWCSLVPKEGNIFNPEFVVADDYSNVNPLCILAMKNLFVFPFVDHFGTGQEGIPPQPCECNGMPESERSDPFNPCNMFDFVTGFMFFPKIDILSSWVVASIFAEPERLRDSKFTFNASVFTSAYGLSREASEPGFNLTSPESLSAAFDFCTYDDPTVGKTSCSMLTVTQYDSGVKGRTVSPYSNQIFAPACSDIFTVNESVWADLVATPFAELNYPYQECHRSPRDAIIEQAGIAFGNLSLIAPAIILLILVMSKGINVLFGIPPSHPDHEVKEVLNEWASLLLYERDNKFREYAADEGEDDDDDDKHHISKAEGVGTKDTGSDRPPVLSVGGGANSADVASSRAEAVRHPLSASIVDELTRQFQHTDIDVSEMIGASLKRSSSILSRTRSVRIETGNDDDEFPDAEQEEQEGRQKRNSDVREMSDVDAEERAEHGTNTFEHKRNNK